MVLEPDGGPADTISMFLRSKTRKKDGKEIVEQDVEAGIEQEMVDVHLPTTDGRTLILSRYTEPQPDQQLLLERLHLQLPAQPVDLRGELTRCLH